MTHTLIYVHEIYYCYIILILQVHNFVRLSELYYAGSHGMDIKGPSKGHKHRKVRAHNENSFEEVYLYIHIKLKYGY